LDWLVHQFNNLVYLFFIFKKIKKKTILDISSSIYDLTSKFSPIFIIPNKDFHFRLKFLDKLTW